MVRITARHETKEEKGEIRSLISTKAPILGTVSVLNIEFYGASGLNLC